MTALIISFPIFFRYVCIWFSVTSIENWQHIILDSQQTHCYNYESFDLFIYNIFFAIVCEDLSDHFSIHFFLQSKGGIISFLILSPERYTLERKWLQPLISLSSACSSFISFFQVICFVFSREQTEDCGFVRRWSWCPLVFMVLRSSQSVLNSHTDNVLNSGSSRTMEDYARMKHYQLFRFFTQNMNEGN